MGGAGSGNSGQAEGLVRAIGGGAGLIVLNSMIGAGIYALPSALAPLGRWGPWMFILAGVAMAAVVITLARLATYFERTGGPVLSALVSTVLAVAGFYALIQWVYLSLGNADLGLLAFAAIGTIFYGLERRQPRA